MGKASYIPAQYFSISLHTVLQTIQTVARFASLFIKLSVELNNHDLHEADTSTRPIC